MCSLSELLTAKRVLPRGDQATSAAKFVEAKSERLEATSNNSRESSAIPSAIVFPSGEKLSVRTIAWKEALAISWPEAILQSKTSLRDLTSPHQPLPVANVRPSGDTARHDSLSPAGHNAKGPPVATSQTRTVWSKLQENKVVPSRENATPVTLSVWPVNLARLVPLLR